MQRQRNYLLTGLLLLLSFTACKRNDLEKSVEAEHIRYDVIYLENMAGDIPTKMLPDIMEAYYSKKHVMTSIKGFFGQFSLVQIANLKQNNVITMLNFFGHKVYYVGKKGELPVGIFPLKNPEIDITRDTMSICGMLSYKTSVKTDEEEYNIYYTEDLNIKSPNITTPYSFIDHVLSDFRVQLSVLKMQLRIKEHETEMIRLSAFEVPDDYEQVSKATMESIINNLFTKE